MSNNSMFRIYPIFQTFELCQFRPVVESVSSRWHKALVTHVEKTEMASDGPVMAKKNGTSVKLMRWLLKRGHWKTLILARMRVESGHSEQEGTGKRANGLRDEPWAYDSKRVATHHQHFGEEQEHLVAFRC